MYNKFIFWLEHHYLTCGFKQLTGFDCIGCGIQRAFVLLLKGNIFESFRMYPALIPILVMIVFTIIHLIFKFKKGGTYLMYNFIVVAGLMVINYSIKLFT